MSFRPSRSRQGLRSSTADLPHPGTSPAMPVALQPVVPLVPAFFGTPGQQLFGIYHAPTGHTVRDAGVVLCHPAPQDYSQTYWAFNKLAGLLAEAGFHVLRFDYAGTGDSQGDSADVRLSQCVQDIAAAVQELRDVSGVRRVSLVGMRVGAALAMRASAAGVRVRDLVLWDPVTRGADYLAEMDAIEDRRLQLLNYPEPDTRLDDEVMGYPFGAALRRETAAIDLCFEPFGRIDRLCIVGSRTDARHEALAAHAMSSEIETEVRVVEDPALYHGTGHPSDSLLAHNVPVAITAFLARTGG